MSKSSINVQPVKPGSEIHNFREKDFDYVRKDLTHLNESWASKSIPDVRKEIEKRYFQSVGQKMQKKATPIREAVVNITESHTMKDLQRLSKALEDRFGVRTFQIHIHRDEGHRGTKNDESKKRTTQEWKKNLHAHLVFDWTDSKTGKGLRLKPLDMVEMQTVVSTTLGMERGASSDRKHLSAIQFKNKAEAERLEKLEKETAEAQNQIDQKSGELQKLEQLAQGKGAKLEKLQRAVLTARTEVKAKEEAIAKAESHLKAVEARRKELDRMGGKYVIKRWYGAVNMAETSVNLQALALENKELKSKNERLEKAVEDNSKAFQDNINLKTTLTHLLNTIKQLVLGKTTKERVAQEFNIKLDESPQNRSETRGKNPNINR